MFLFVIYFDIIIVDILQEAIFSNYSYMYTPRFLSIVIGDVVILICSYEEVDLL